MESVRLPFWLKLACVLIIITISGFILIAGEQLIVPLLFSFLFAILLLPVANFFECKVRVSRSLASIIAVLLFVVAISIIVFLLGSQIKNLSTEWPLLKVQLTSLFQKLHLWLESTFHLNLQSPTELFNNETDGLFRSSAAIVESTVLSLSSILLFIIFALVYTVLILFYRNILMQFIVAAFDRKYTHVIYEIVENIKHIIRKYITGLAFEMAIVATIACLVFWTLGVKYVFLLGLLVGILNIIPYVGIFTSFLISVSITFAMADTKHALFVGIAIICIHLFDSNVLMPKIVGSQVKINPLMVILGVIVGELIYGISGMFLSIPYLAIAKIIFDRVEGMGAFGILLGEERHPPKKINKAIKKNEKER